MPRSLPHTDQRYLRVRPGGGLDSSRKCRGSAWGYVKGGDSWIHPSINCGQPRSFKQFRGVRPHRRRQVGVMRPQVQNLHRPPDRFCKACRIGEPRNQPEKEWVLLGHESWGPMEQVAQDLSGLVESFLVSKRVSGCTQTTPLAHRMWLDRFAKVVGDSLTPSRYVSSSAASTSSS